MKTSSHANKVFKKNREIRLKIKEIAEILKAKIIADSEYCNIDIRSAYSADLMSAVLYYHTPDSMLITGLVHIHVIRTAEIAGIKIIVFTSGKDPDIQIIELAKQKKIPLLITPFCSYTASGKLYQSGMPGCADK